MKTKPKPNAHPEKIGIKKIFLIMKMTLLIFFLGVFQLSAISIFSQEKKISLDMQDVTVREVIKEIEKQGELSFLFNEDLTELNTRISLSMFNKPVAMVLDEALKKARMSFQVIKEGFVVLLPYEKLLAIQPRIIIGTVTDANTGEPLGGVNVMVVGSIIGTITDADGNFSIDIPNDDVELQASFVGYKTTRVPVKGLRSINIILTPESLAIDEVVVVGYGTQKKINLTGAVSVATAERLENRPIVSIGQGLQGVIPNLNIKYNSGSPTESADFNIRGYESINGGSPLILVDGVPMALEQLNPNDIASITVLKDASAGAVYGARAAFGVILVETKKSMEGKVNITVSTEQSYSKPIFLIDPVTDPYECVTAMNIATINRRGTPWFDDDYVAGTKAYSENPTNENAWGIYNNELRFYGFNNYHEKVVADFSPQNKYDMTISGRSERASIYVGLGLLSKDGNLKNNEKNEHFERYNILMKADYRIAKWLSLDEKIVYTANSNNQPTNSYGGEVSINSVARMAPLFPLEFPDLPYYLVEGDHDQFERFIGMPFSAFNFLPYLEKGGRTTFNRNDFWFTQGVTLTPLKGLNIRGDFSYNNFHNELQNVKSKIELLENNYLIGSIDLTNINIYNGTSANDFIENRSDYNQYYVFNTYADYTIEQFSNHYFKATVGFNQEWGRNSYYTVKGYTLLTPEVQDISATTGQKEASGGKSEIALRGAFYRLNYIFKDKYLFETSGRYDGTSRFPKESRFGFFPSVSVGWRISRENFMNATKGWLDNLKLRASYGALGNQLLEDYYPYISTMSPGMSAYVMSSTGYIPYILAADLVSPTLTWESVTTLNFGLDLLMLKQRLDVSFDIYTRDTKNMLMSIEYPSVLGTTAPKQNAADLRTKGWELLINWRDKIGQDLKYEIQLSLSDNQAEITKYDNPTGALSEYYVGKKLGEIWGFETAGIFQSDEDVAAAPDQSEIGSNWHAGDMQYADLNNDSTINRGSQTLEDPGDMRIIGNSTPRYSFGINPTISYKGWSLDIFFQGLFRDFLPSPSGFTAFYPFATDMIQDYYISESWSEDNRDAYFPRPLMEIGTETKNILPQSRFVQNAAYIRLKSLTLSYDLPMNILDKVGANRAQIYLSGLNLWEYTKMHKPLDVEQSDDLTQKYYFQRIFSLGAKITF